MWNHTRTQTLQTSHALDITLLDEPLILFITATIVQDLGYVRTAKVGLTVGKLSADLVALTGFSETSCSL